MNATYRAAVIGCGRMGATIDDQMLEWADRDLWVPMSHAAAFATCERTELIAVCSRSQEWAEAARQRYRVPRAYTDYRELIERAQPDIVSVATRPANHLEIVRFAADHRVRAIYCEKPLCLSMREADEMLAVCSEHGVRFNYGTQYRFMHVYRQLRADIASGAVGEIKAVTAHMGLAPAMWALTHAADLLLMLAGDPEITCVQSTAVAESVLVAGNQVTTDPLIASAYMQFANGIHGYIIPGPPTSSECEVVGSDGVLRTMDNGLRVQWRRPGPVRPVLEEVAFPEVPRESGTLLLILDLVRALDTATNTLGPLALACRSQDLIFGLIESHLHGGARVRLPLANRELTVGTPDW